MTIEEMKRIKKEKGYSYTQIAQMSGVPLGTVQKVFGGETANPRYDTLQALESLFNGESGTHSSVREEEAAYGSVKKQGDYTVEDYYALPEDKRVELIDGVFYDMSSPTFVHQRIGGEIHRQIANFILDHKGSCIPLMSPVDVRLDCDNRTMVQPDVIVLCDRDKIMKWGIMGAPDFLAEVLSLPPGAGTVWKKPGKYLNAGVKEYWIVDPYKRKLIVYDLESGDYPSVYGLNGKVPVGIFGGKLMIDLDMIGEMVVDYPDEGRD